MLTPRWPKFAIGGGAIVAVGVGAFFALGGPAQSEDGCHPGAQRMAEVWSDASRNAVSDAFHRTGLQYADATAETTVAQMDGWASTWEAAYDQACQTGDEAAAQRLCLETQLAQLEGLVHVFERSNRSTVAGAGPSVARLPEPSSCADPLYTELPAPPEGKNDAVQHLRLQLALAKAKVIALELGRGIAALEGLETKAVELEYAPLTAEVELELAVAYFKAGRMDDAEKVLLEAMEVAEGVGHVVVRAEAWLWSMQIQGSVHRRFDEALRMSDPARAAVARCGEGHARLHVRLEALLSEILRLEGDYEQSEVAARKAVDLAQKHRGEDSLDTALAYRTLALVLRERGQFEEALEFAEQTVAVNERVLGPDHPETAGRLGDVATILSYTDADPERTLALWKRAHAINESAYPPGHRSQAVSAHAIATTLATLDRSEEAVAYFEQALEVDAANEGADHPASVPTMYGLGMALIELDRLDEGRAQLEHAHQIIVPVIGKDHPDLSYTLGGLGLLEYLSGDPEAGRVHFEHARTNLLAKFEPNNSRVHKLDLDWAEAAFRAGLLEEAAGLLSHARTIADGTGTSDLARGRGLWLSAQVEAERGDDAAARESATAALELDPSLEAEIARWLAGLK